MKNQQMTTLGNVAERVHAMSENYHDELVPVSDITFKGLEDVRIGSETYELKEAAQGAIASRLGVPVTFARKCPPELAALNLNHFLQDEKNDELFFRFDGDTVRAVFTPRYKPVDNSDIINRLMIGMGFPDDKQVQCNLDSEFMMLNVPNDALTYDISGDVHTPGISIGNSEVGKSSLALASYTLRLICTNGLVTTEELASARYRHVKDGVLDLMPSVLYKLMSESANQKDKLKISLEKLVEDPMATIESLNRQFQLSEQERQAVDWAWPHEKGTSMFNVVQTYTKASQYQPLTAESSYRLQNTGGKVLSMVG